jgi:putative DNA primase/helicase
MKSWLVWDGRRWAVDDRGMATQLVKRMARKITAQARKALKTIGRDEFEGWRKFALKSESHRAILAALEMAATEPGMPISANDLDQNAYLLNCPNGMIDLRSSKLLPHDRGVPITKLCHVEFDANARCDQFQTFLHWAMGENPDAG